MVLAISREGRRQNVQANQAGTFEITRHKMEPSLRQPVFDWTVKD